MIVRQQTLGLQAVAHSDIASFLDGDQIRWVSNIGDLLSTGAQWRSPAYRRAPTPGHGVGRHGRTGARCVPWFHPVPHA
jgi:hypothetical protein